VDFNEIICHNDYHSKQLNTIWDNRKPVNVITDSTYIRYAL